MPTVAVRHQITGAVQLMEQADSAARATSLVAEHEPFEDVQHRIYHEKGAPAFGTGSALPAGPSATEPVTFVINQMLCRSRSRDDDRSACHSHVNDSTRARLHARPRRRITNERGQQSARQRFSTRGDAGRRNGDLMFIAISKAGGLLAAAPAGEGCLAAPLPAWAAQADAGSEERCRTTGRKRQYLQPDTRRQYRFQRRDRE